jgi:pentatricopeptide repeat protein
VRIVQDRYDDAVRLYRQALDLDPKNPDALNNLATLLSEASDTRAEALQLVDRAIELAGPTPPLLDTKGTALIYDGKPQEAIPVLERATAGFGRDPRFPFHLAAAYCRAGQTAKAKEVFRQVGQRDLKKQILTKKDQELLAELEQKLLQ